MANCKISSTGAVYMNIFGMIKIDFLPAGCKIEMDSIVVYADPVVVEDTVKADYIFITHNHLDHFLKKDVKKLSKSGTLIIGPKSVTKKIKETGTKTVSIGDTIDFGRIKYEVVESYNTRSKIHKKGSNYVGYVISCDTTRIYVAGDTDLIPEMEELENITVAIIPIGEGKTAMDPQSAAKAISIIRPELVIPVHYELKQGREEEFLKWVDDEVRVTFFQKD